MTKESNAQLTMMWLAVDLPVKEEPNLFTACTLRIDENALVLETKAQEGLIVGLGLFVMCVALVIAPLILWHDPPFSMKKFAIMGTGGTWLIAFLAGTFLELCLIGTIGLAIYLLNFALLKSAPSPIICDRRAGKIYGSYKGKPVKLDWKQVKPILTQSVALAVGIQRYYHLVFFQPETPETWSSTGKHRGNAIIVSPGLPWGWGTCHAVYEFIRRYMEEPPEQAPERLPPVTVAPKEERWVTRVLDHGVYDEWTEPEGRMERLRERDGRPEITPGETIQATLMAPALVMNLLQVHARRVVQLPAAWWPKPATGPNPYATVETKPGDVELRRKAAKAVRNWLIGCVGIGCAWWTWVAVEAIIHL
jgi:hypothetical protein